MIFKLANYYWIRLCGLKRFSVENRNGRFLVLLFSLIIIISISVLSYSLIKWQNERNFISLKTAQIEEFELNFASKRFYNEFGATIDKLESDFVELDLLDKLLDPKNSFNKDNRFNEQGLSGALRKFLDEVKYGNNVPSIDMGVLDQANIFAKRLEKNWWWKTGDFYRHQLAKYLVDYYVIIYNYGTAYLDVNSEIAYKTSEHLQDAVNIRDNYLRDENYNSLIESAYGIEAFEQEKTRFRDLGGNLNKSPLFEGESFPAEYTNTFLGLFMYSEYIDPFAIKSNLSQAKKELWERDNKSYIQFLLELVALIGFNILLIILLRIINWVRG